MFNKFRKHAKIWALAIAIMFILATVLSIALPLFVHGASLSEQVKEQQQKQEELQKKINEADKEKESTIEKKKLIDEVVSHLQGDIDEINTELAGLEKEIKEKEDEIKAAQKLIDEKEAQYKQRFRVLYEEGSMGYLKMLLDAESISDFLYRWELMKVIVENDRNLLDEMEAAKQIIELAKAQIEENKAQVDKQKEVLVDKKALASAKQQEQQRIIDDIQKNTDAWQKQLDAAEAAEAALKRQIAASASNSNSSTYTGGKFEWPVPSSYRITSEFSAARMHPVLGYVRRHDGIDIGASQGSNIIAAGEGKVLFAGWNGGYGNCVIIDHGGGYTTLYGHASTLLVSSGQSVSRGQSIAKIGSTGVSTGPHLHFEVCINGVAKEPTQFLK